MAAWFPRLFGFSPRDLTSFGSLVKLLNRPYDPASLGLLRLMYGVLMLIDIPQERGLAHLDSRFADGKECRFPLFDFLRPLPLKWMYVMYFAMMSGAAGIALGFLFRLSCLLFLVPYWYVFMLDKTSWNNHSYLYGLMSILLFVSDANRYWSLDGLLFRKKRNAHVPLWNYTILRFQIFTVYFIAGLKKLDPDWITGNSMTHLSEQWVFAPFRLVLSNDQIDFFLVHVCGLTLDLFVGFLMFFDASRPIAFFFCAQFHLMNSQMFSIGMFPWMMLATMPLFCYADWPRTLLKKIPLTSKMLSNDISPSESCLYEKEDIKSDKKKPLVNAPDLPPMKPTLRHKLGTLFVFIWVAIQLFLPYSHGLTRGYNNWTNGLYGYSWDMMVHTWNTQHIRISYTDLNTGDTGYLNPEAWLNNKAEKRWSSHSDMIKQYATCISDRLVTYNLKNVSLSFDIWKSMNRRFHQRMVDPRVDILKAGWSPSRQTSWTMPLLIDLTDWRTKLRAIEDELFNATEYTDVVFIADFPELSLENYVQADLKNTSVTVLEGKVVVELPDVNKNFTLSKGDKMQLPYDAFHTIHTVSDTPSCYMYIYVNSTERVFSEKLTQYDTMVNITKSNPFNYNIKRAIDSFEISIKDHHKQLQQKREANKSSSTIDNLKQFVNEKYKLFMRGFHLMFGALSSVLTKSDFDEFLIETYNHELSAPI